jgi:hypothetical protein
MRAKQVSCRRASANYEGCRCANPKRKTRIRAGQAVVAIGRAPWSRPRNHLTMQFRRKRG